LALLESGTVDLIINTHAHIDHYLYNNHFPNSKIFMHQADHGIAQSSEKYLEEFGFKEFWQHPEILPQVLEGIGYSTSRIDGEITDKQVINLGATTMETLHLPGHSPGHCGFIFPQQGFIFTADIDLSKFGPWYGMMSCSLADLFESIDKLLDMKPDYIITSHGEAVIKGDVSKRLKEYRDIVFARQRRIVDLIYKGRHSLEEIASEVPVYVQLPNPKSIFYIYEQVMVLNHLKYLKEQGYIIEDKQRYYMKAGIHPSKIS
jgi:glyoxylase-like metal-dependent hydrolase (beta-lactamase superfamily II)